MFDKDVIEELDELEQALVQEIGGAIDSAVSGKSTGMSTAGMNDRELLENIFKMLSDIQEQVNDIQRAVDGGGEGEVHDA